MKTAIIKTTFWDDEEFERLNLDTKLLYFYLLANPTRTLHKISKINNKIISAYTGLSLDQIEICKGQLEQSGLVAFNDRFYLLLKDYVEAKKGRFTSKVIAKEDSEIPLKVKKYFSTYRSEISNGIMTNYTGTLPEYNNKDNNNNKNKIKNTDKKNEVKILSIEEVSETEKKAQEILDFFNSNRETNYKTYKPFLKNLEYWLGIYTVEDIKTAIKNIKYDDYWKNESVDLVWLTRTMNPQREPVDYIGKLSNLKNETTEAIKEEKRKLEETERNIKTIQQSKALAEAEKKAELERINQEIKNIDETLAPKSETLEKKKGKLQQLKEEMERRRQETSKMTLQDSKEVSDAQSDTKVPYVINVSDLDFQMSKEELAAMQKSNIM